MTEDTDDKSADTPGVEAWKEHTTAFDRVRAVAEALSQPRSAPAVAEEAAVAENTARDHLDRLVEMNVLLAVEREGRTVYAPDPLYTRVRTLRDLLEEHDRDGLLALKAEMQARIEDWREKYGVESADDLRARAAETGTAAETRESRQTANRWEVVAYRLDIVEEAIENYGTYSRDAAPA
jgi:predicted ArsR family transcriptional regulator